MDGLVEPREIDQGLIGRCSDLYLSKDLDKGIFFGFWDKRNQPKISVQARLFEQRTPCHRMFYCATRAAELHNLRLGPVKDGRHALALLFDERKKDSIGTEGLTVEFQFTSYLSWKCYILRLSSDIKENVVQN